MWPYDYFHQVSTIEIDEKIGSEKSVFVSIWFGGEEKQSPAYNQQQKKIELIKKIVGQLKIGNTSFQPRIVNESGEIFSKIQQDIIKSTFVICDLTPRWYESEIYFCDNVLFELGLAMAWKMEEQVILLWDKQGEEKKKFHSKHLPSDFKTHYVDEVDSSNEGEFKEDLTRVIKKRYESFEYRKDIFIKNAKSKLDLASLRFLRNQKGLLFADPPVDVISLMTLRHLMDLGIIRAIIYRNDWTFAYYLTKFGRIILEKEFGVRLFPEILADMLFVRYFRFDPEGEFRKKIKYWEDAYQKKFWECLRSFNDLIPSAIKEYFKGLIKSDNQEDFDLDMFSRYLEDLSLDYFEKVICEKWENKLALVPENLGPGTDKPL
ncbi:MAG: hypothetical protein HZB36_03280 [Candidatus Omnitrophica bacterium]|nr:hypothetical protein [Candidatus Omnitrophota bacterium]